MQWESFRVFLSFQELLKCVRCTKIYLSHNTMLYIFWLMKLFGHIFWTLKSVYESLKCSGYDPSFSLTDFVLALFYLSWFWTYFSPKKCIPKQSNCNFSWENFLSNLLRVSISQKSFLVWNPFYRLANRKEPILSQEKYLKTFEGLGHSHFLS